MQAHERLLSSVVLESDLSFLKPQSGCCVQNRCQEDKSERDQLGSFTYSHPSKRRVVAWTKVATVELGAKQTDYIHI